MKNKITACLVIYNEEEVLERCLKSIVNVVNEIIVVHDGKCNDKSLQIAKKYNARVFVKNHIGEAEYHRPFAFKKAKGDWILHIDADEYLSKKAQIELPKLVKTKKCDGFEFSWPIWLFSKKEYLKRGPYSKLRRLCLYRKNKMFMLGLTHFHPITTGAIKRRDDILLHHKPKNNNLTYKSISKKIFKWSKIYAQQAVKAESLPYYGKTSVHKKVLYELKNNHINRPILYMSLELIKRLLWYIRYGGLLSSLNSHRVLTYELMYIFYKHYYLLLLKINRE